MAEREFKIYQCYGWPEVKEIVAKNDLHLLGRSCNQQLLYADFAEQIKQNWMSVKDFLLSNKFGFESRTDLATGKRMIAFTEDLSSLNIMSMSKNDFPYNFKPGIQHYILWKLGSELTETEVNNAVASEMEKNPTYIDYTTYVNPPHLKSIPEIEHAHLLFYETFKGADSTI